MAERVRDLEDIAEPSNWDTREGPSAEQREKFLAEIRSIAEELEKEAKRLRDESCPTKAHDPDEDVDTGVCDDERTELADRLAKLS